MRQTAAPWSSRDALDQWGIQFPLLPEELDGLVQPTSRSLARVISSWRLSIATLLPGHGETLDQWGIEFPITPDEPAALGGNWRGGRSQARIAAMLGGRLRVASRFGAYGAILAVVVAGSASAVPSTPSADALPTRNEPSLVLVGDSAQTASLASITVQPSATSSPTPVPTSGATSNPTPDPTPGVTLPAEAIALQHASNTPAPAVLEARPLQAESVALPTIQDARNYLVARLGARQSRCASLVFEYESTWNPHATNKRSGAYGLPQAYPASKLANWAEAKAAAAEKAGDAEAAWLYRAWRDNPVVQAEWGVDYMIERYGSPCAALAFRNAVGWY